MIIDTHTHMLRECTADALRESLALTGVDRILLASLPPPRHQSGLASNEDAARIRDLFPDRVAALIGIYPPHVDESLREIDRYHKRGFVGVKIMPNDGYLPDDERHLRVFEEINARKMIVLSHCGRCAPAGNPDIPQCTLNSHPYRFEPLIRVFTDTDFIFAHAGGRTMYEAAFDLVRHHENAWTDTCPGNGTWVLKFAPREWLDVLNWDRLLFGTDTVYGDRASALHYAERETVIREAIEKAGFGARYAAVQCHNASSLLRKHGVWV